MAAPTLKALFMLYQIVKESTNDDGETVELVFYVKADSIKDAISMWEVDSAWNKESHIKQITKLSSWIIV